MFSTAIILKLNVSKEFDKKYQEFNTASSYVTIPAPLYSGDLLTKINKIEDIEKAETKKGIYTKVTKILMEVIKNKIKFSTIWMKKLN